MVVPNGFLNGARAYADRSYTFSSVPSSMRGLTYIQTSNNDMRSDSNSFMNFTADEDITVFVAHDDRIRRKPRWLSSFADTRHNILIRNKTLSVFAKDFSKGRITLGGNGGDRRSRMYSVIIADQEAKISFMKEDPFNNVNKIGIIANIFQLLYAMFDADSARNAANPFSIINTYGVRDIPNEDEE
jgi:hypothetical protein